MKKLFVASALFISTLLYAAPPVVWYGKVHDTLYEYTNTSRSEAGVYEICTSGKPILLGVPNEMSVDSAVSLFKRQKQRSDTVYFYQSRKFPLGVLFVDKKKKVTTFGISFGEGLPSIYVRNGEFIEKEFLLKTFIIAGIISMLFTCILWWYVTRKDSKKNVPFDFSWGLLLIVILTGVLWVSVAIILNAFATRILGHIEDTTSHLISNIDYSTWSLFTLLQVFFFIWSYMYIRRKKLESMNALH